MMSGGMNDRVQSYQNICNILTESVSKAKENLAHLAPGASASAKKTTSNSPIGNNKQSELVGLQTDQRIVKQKK